VIDNVFTGFGGLAEVASPEEETILTLSADPAFAQLVLYVPDQATQMAEMSAGIPPYFCAEPVSNITDAFNQTGETGVITLAPGERFSGEIRFNAREGRGS
jgi:aldose 1-epimerase